MNHPGRTHPLLDHGTLLELKRWNTPTMYNGWEAILEGLDAADRGYRRLVEAKLHGKGEW